MPKLFEHIGENVVEIAGGRFRVERGPRRRRETATEAILDDAVTARDYQVGRPDALGKKIVLGKPFDFIDYRQRKTNPCFTLYELTRIDEVLMDRGPLAGQKILQPRYTPVKDGVFDSEDEAVARALELIGVPPAAGMGATAVYLNDRVLDFGINILDTEADRFDICSQEPATYTEATSTYTLGNKDHGAAGSAFGSPQDGDTSGRKVASTAVTDGSVTGTGTATHWAISDVGNTRLLAAQSLSSSQGVTSGNTWAMPSLDVEIPDPS